MSCWWAAIRMLTAYYGEERAEPGHWNPRFDAPSSPAPSSRYAHCAPPRPLGSARLAMEGHYAHTFALIPPHLWMDRGIPPTPYALEVLADLMRGRLAAAPHGFAGPADWTVESFEAYLRRVGPVLVTRALQGFYDGRAMGYHMVIAAGVQNGWVLYRDPNPALRQWRGLPLDEFRREFSQLPFMRWVCTTTTPRGIEEGDLVP
jgi:hypothetical protein